MFLRWLCKQQFCRTQHCENNILTKLSLYGTVQIYLELVVVTHNFRFTPTQSYSTIEMEFIVIKSYCFNKFKILKIVATLMFNKIYIFNTTYSVYIE